MCDIIQHQCEGAALIHLQIDPHSGVPIYRQVMDQVKYYAASGVLKPGAQLPSIRELSKALAVNPTTVVKAYTELEHEGVVEMKQGKGAFLSEAASKMAPDEYARALERLARQLAVEAKQMGAPRELVMRVVEEEIDRISAAESLPPPPGAQGHESDGNVGNLQEDHP
jgi:GntR family transcriptional regulator